MTTVVDSDEIHYGPWRHTGWFYRFVLGYHKYYRIVLLSVGGKVVEHYQYADEPYQGFWL